MTQNGVGSPTDDIGRPTAEQRSRQLRRGRTLQALSETLSLVCRRTFSGLEGLPKSRHLLFPQLDLVSDLPGIHHQLGLHLDEVVVISKLSFVQILLQTFIHLKYEGGRLIYFIT